MEQMEYAQEEDDDLFDNLLEKGEQFDQLFIEEIIKIVQKLFAEDIIKNAFGKNIPVIIHELEYYDEPISWTKKANPKELIEEFLEAYKNGFS